MRRVRLRGLAGLVLLASAIASLAASPASMGQAQPTDEPAASAESPLKRKDVPPQGVDALFGLGGGAGSGFCTFLEGGVVETRAGSECLVEVADSTDLRFPGLASGQEVAFRITRPDGAIEQDRATADAEGMVILERVALPDDPLGAYAIVASQGARQRTGTYTLRRATEPQNTVYPSLGPPGTTFRVVLAGLQPGQSVPLQLYRALGFNFTFLTSLPTVQANERGEALYALRTAVDDPEDRYIIDTRPLQTGSIFRRGFTVSRTRDSASARADQTAALALAVVEDAIRIASAVFAKDGAPIAELERAFGGQALAELRGEAERFRAQRKYAVLRLTAPVEVRSVTAVTDRSGCTQCLEAFTVEHWDKQLYNADGSLIETGRWREEWRLVMSWDAGPDSTRTLRYRIVEQELLRAE